MIPLALGGPATIGLAVSGALVLLALILRAESRDEAREKADRGASDEPPQLP